MSFLNVFRVMFVCVALVLAACGIESMDPAMIGGWTVPVSELPDQIRAGVDEDVDLVIGIRGASSAPGYAGSVSLGLGCSSFGGPVSSFEPLEFPMVTVAGVGGCGARDEVANTVMQQIKDKNLQVVDGKLVIVLDGERILLTKR